MPFKSKAQQGYFHANVGKKPGITPSVVDEFDQASKGMSLPERVGPKKPSKKPRKKRAPMSSKMPLSGKMGGYLSG